MSSTYIRIRHIIGAPGKTHSYLAETYVIEVETNKVTKHPPREIKIDDTLVRLKDKDCPKWDLQRNTLSFYPLRETDPEYALFKVLIAGVSDLYT